LCQEWKARGDFARRVVSTVLHIVAIPRSGVYTKLSLRSDFPHLASKKAYGVRHRLGPEGEPRIEVGAGSDSLYQIWANGEFEDIGRPFKVCPDLLLELLSRALGKICVHSAESKPIVIKNAINIIIGRDLADKLPCALHVADVMGIHHKRNLGLVLR